MTEEIKEEINKLYNGVLIEQNNSNGAWIFIWRKLKNKFIDLIRFEITR